MKILIVLRLAEHLARPYYDAIAPAFPDQTIDMVDHIAKAAPYLGAADVLASFGGYLSDEALAQATNLKWIHLFSTGVDGVMLRRTLRPDVLVTNTPGIHASSVSEAAFLAMLALARRFRHAVGEMERHVWGRWSSSLLEGKTVGILGMGLIAEGLAPRCKAFGMRVVGITGTPREVPGFDEVRRRDPLPAALGDLDHLVVLTPYSKATHGIIDAAALAAMKPGAFLVNLARGRIVDEPALIRALNSGHLGGAALDVAATEPLPPEDPLWRARNILITPHVAAMYDEYPARAAAVFNENLRRFLAGDIASMLNRVAR